MSLTTERDRDAQLRLFFALWPTPPVRSALAALLPLVSGRRVKPENLHITLAFLGNQPARLLPQLLQMAKQIGLAHDGLQIDQLGYFRRKRIAWAGMSHTSASLLASREALVKALNDAGIGFDASAPFRPHVTLAREAEPPASVQLEPVLWRPGGIALVASKSMPGGVTYTVLDEGKPAPGSEGAA